MCRLTEREREYLQSEEKRDPNYWLQNIYGRARKQDYEYFIVHTTDFNKFAEEVRAEQHYMGDPAPLFDRFMKDLQTEMHFRWRSLDDEIKEEISWTTCTLNRDVSVRTFIPYELGKETPELHENICRSIVEASRDKIEGSIIRNLFNHYMSSIEDRRPELNMAIELTKLDVEEGTFNVTASINYNI